MALSVGFNKMYGLLRHKYMSGLGEVIDVGNGTGSTLLQNVNAETTPSAQDVAILASSSLFKACITTDRELVLPSASEAAKFKVGDAISVITVGAQQTRATATVQNVKGQKLMLTANIGAGLDADSLVVRFGTGGIDGVPQVVEGNAAGLQYLGMGEMAAFLNALQVEVSHSGTANLTGGPSASGAFSSVPTDIDNVSANLLDGDIVVLSNMRDATAGATDTEFDGMTAVVQSHGTGANVAIVLGQFKLADGTLLGDQLPLASSKANGTAVSLTVDASTNIEVRASVCDPFIAKIMGPDFPLSGAGRAVTDSGLSLGLQENSNDPGAVSSFLSGLFAFIMKYDRDATGGALSEVIPMDTEESLLGHMINYRTARGKRLVVEAQAASGQALVTVEMDRAVGDLPIPLAGTCRALSNIGVGNAQGSTGVGVDPAMTASPFSYTRDKGGNVLTMSATLSTQLEPGDIIELEPAHGIELVAHSQDVRPADFMVVLEKAWRVANDYATATGIDSGAEIPNTP